MEVTDVGAPAGTKVRRSLLRKAKQFLIPWLIICLLCICHDKLIFHGFKEDQALLIARVEHVVCTCSW